MTTVQQHSSRSVRVKSAIRTGSYITVFENVLMANAGRLVNLVLMVTVLYSCAELYVQLPAPANTAMFLVQMAALDIGGYGLATLARIARRDGDITGAKHAAWLGGSLIVVMLVSVITAGLEQKISVPGAWKAGIDLTLIVIRSGCSVFYGRVIHALKEEHSTSNQEQKLSEQANDLTNQFTEKFSSELRKQVESVTASAEQKLSDLSQKFSSEFTYLINQAQSDRVELVAISETTEAHSIALAALPGLIERQSRDMKQAMQELRASIETSPSARPKLSLVAPEKLSEKLSSTDGLNSKEFIEDYLTTHPEARNVDVIAEATKHGVTLSPSYVSQTRKAFTKVS